MSSSCDPNALNGVSGVSLFMIFRSYSEGFLLLTQLFAPVAASGEVVSALSAAGAVLALSV